MVINHCLPWWTSDSSKEAVTVRKKKEPHAPCPEPYRRRPCCSRHRLRRPLVTAAAAVRSAIARAVESGGGLDILVNNAGIGAQETVLDSAPDPAAERAALEARQPHGRLVSANEVAHAVLYLASPRAGSTTGAEIAVDGGMAGLRLRPRT